MEDTTTPFNGLSPAEAERLAFLMEEAGEVIQACGKILRHGYESYGPISDKSNRIELLQEIADFSAIMTLMLKAGDFPHPPTNDMIKRKLEKLAKYSHHQ